MRFLVSFQTPRILRGLFCYFLLFLFWGNAPVLGECETGLELYVEKKFDQAIQVAYAQLKAPDLSVSDKLCAFKVLGISYYAKGDLYKDSVEFYMKQIVRLNPQYTFDPDDNWPPFCADLIYKYQRRWKEAYPSPLPLPLPRWPFYHLKTAP